MKKFAVEEAVGHVLGHDLTRIVPGEMKGPQFRKGHIIQREDIPMLLSMGKEHIYVWEKSEDMYHEEEAAEILFSLCACDSVGRKGPAEGKIEVFALHDGLLRLRTDSISRINALGDLIVVTRHNNSAVKAGEKIAAVKAIPLVVPKARLEEARVIAGADGGAPLLGVLPYKLRSACVITTGSEVARGLIEDRFTPVVVKKLAAFGIEMKRHIVTGDGVEELRRAIEEGRREKPDLVLCTGGMSVDPDDNTPGAIKKSGAEIISYGAPVVPGAMFLLGYYDDGTPVAGLPGCVMYQGTTVFDLVLPRIAAGVRLSREDFAGFGIGGLCLGCPECRYPVCPFGR
ncbi:MAG: molybdopterin-binding protein [Treponema sp.]|nr:molybdopterin-binding protein [Treponema sp.]